MSRQVVLVDMDGCLTEHNSMFMAWLNQENGTNHRYEDIRTFEYNHLTPKERQRVHDYWGRWDLYDHHPAEPGALAALSVLRQYYRVVVVSSPMAGHIQSKYRWLRKVGKFDRSDIALITDKSLIHGDLLIDDAIHNLEVFAGGPTLCFDRPWNQEWTGPRARSWVEVPGMVDTILEVVRQKKASI